MSVIVLLIVAGGSVAGGFLVAFVWAVRSGQFDDTFTPAVRVLVENDKPPASAGARLPAGCGEAPPKRLRRGGGGSGIGDPGCGIRDAGCG